MDTFHLIIPMVLNHLMAGSFFLFYCCHYYLKGFPDTKSALNQDLLNELNKNKVTESQTVFLCFLRKRLANERYH